MTLAFSNKRFSLRLDLTHCVVTGWDQNHTSNFECFYFTSTSIKKLNLKLNQASETKVYNPVHGFECSLIPAKARKTNLKSWND